MKDKEGKTPLRLANEFGDEELVALFDPEERKKTEQIENLELENAQLRVELKVLPHYRFDLSY